jgi:hypothetical protein
MQLHSLILRVIESIYLSLNPSATCCHTCNKITSLLYPNPKPLTLNLCAVYCVLFTVYYSLLSTILFCRLSSVYYSRLEAKHPTAICPPSARPPSALHPFPASGGAVIFVWWWAAGIQGAISCSPPSFYLHRQGGLSTFNTKYGRHHTR